MRSVGSRDGAVRSSVHSPRTASFVSVFTAFGPVCGCEQARFYPLYEGRMTPTLGHQFECISSMALLLICRSFTSNMKAPIVFTIPRMGPPKPTIGTPRSSTSQGPKTRQKPSSSFTSFRRFSKAPRSWPVNYSRARRYIHNRSNYLTYLPAFLPTYQRPNKLKTASNVL